MNSVDIRMHSVTIRIRNCPSYCLLFSTWSGNHCICKRSYTTVIFLLLCPPYESCYSLTVAIFGSLFSKKPRKHLTSLYTIIKQYDRKDTDEPLKMPCIFILLYMHKLWSYNKITCCGGKFQQDEMFGNVDCLTRSKRFTYLLPHTDAYTSQ